MLRNDRLNLLRSSSKLLQKVMEITDYIEIRKTKSKNEIRSAYNGKNMLCFRSFIKVFNMQYYKN